jgi:hypothetical protein
VCRLTDQHVLRRLPGRDFRDVPFRLPSATGPGVRRVVRVVVFRGALRAPDHLLRLGAEQFAEGEAELLRDQCHGVQCRLLAVGCLAIEGMVDILHKLKELGTVHGFKVKGLHRFVSLFCFFPPDLTGLKYYNNNSICQ